MTRYGHDSIVALRALDIGEARVVLAAPPGTTLAELGALRPLRVATTYPHLTARFLNWLHAPDYRLIEVWGRPEAWPPEDADAAVLALSADDEGSSVLAREGLEAIAEVHRGSAWLVANRHALAERDLQEGARSAAAASRAPRPRRKACATVRCAQRQWRSARTASPSRSASGTRSDNGALRLAVPDGHAQRHTVEALAAAGIAFEGYDQDQAVRRPRSPIEGVTVKVIRPQDMPQAVALGRFDVALTGRDWLATHLAAFPASPVAELCDLHRSRYRMGAVVSEDVPAETIAEAVEYWRRDDPRRANPRGLGVRRAGRPYARDRRLGRYRVIPIAGASEGFVPDDAEILIEGSETGTTLRANRLRMIDVIMESTNCAIGSTIRRRGRAANCATGWWSDWPPPPRPPPPRPPPPRPATGRRRRRARGGPVCPRSDRT